MHNIFRMFQKEIKSRLKNIILWCIGLIVIICVYMLLFQLVKEMFIKEMEAFPPELMEIFGMGDAMSFTNYNTYFGAIIGIVTIILAVYAILLSMGIFRDEETSKTIEFSNSLNISRRELWTAKILAVLCILTLFVIIIMTTGIICGYIVAHKEVEAGYIVLTMIVVYLILIIFSSLGFLITCSINKIRPQTLGLTLIFGTYLLGYLASIGPKAFSFLKYISPLDFLSPGKFMSTLINNANFDIYGFIIAIIVIPASILSSFLFYRRRNF